MKTCCAIGPETRLRDLTVGEFLSLLSSAGATPKGRYITGLRKIARYLNTSRGSVERAARSERYGKALRMNGGRWELDTALYERIDNQSNTNSYE